MFNFRTEVNVPKSKYKISHQDKILTIGSCFSENIGKYFLASKFKTVINPFGILYNPVSIYKCIEFIKENKEFTENDLVFYNEQWHSFYHHGRFSSSDKKTCLKNINESVRNNSLKDIDFLIITFGSSYVYEYKTNFVESNYQGIVANCHKIPEKNFSQYLLKLDDIVSLWEKMIKEIVEINPSIKIIFTVSPIRYLKYGNELNQISKSILLLSINQLKKKFENIEYFPAYEIVMDDLRDYRFYEEDMIHPNKTAIDYIWNKLSDIYFDNSTKNLLEAIKKIQLAKQHRPRNPDSKDHLSFLENQLKNIDKLNRIKSDIDFSDEVNYFNNKITAFNS